jgi:rRNA maturation endonuclease Nob1
VNYCPVCKREYKEMHGRKTGHCPVCGSTLVQISDDKMDQMHQKNIRKKD